MEKLDLVIPPVFLAGLNTIFLKSAVPPIAEEKLVDQFILYVLTVFVISLIEMLVLKAKL